jgi:WD40 repeat protein
VARLQLSAARRKSDMARDKDSFLVDAVYTTATAGAKITADAKVLAPLATDCLRFSMHFFHPIQQCAQHVYYTALPLSPTSSQLREYCLQSVTDSQLSRVTAFSGAPDAWGLLLRTIDVRPKRLTCIATFAQRIIAACEDIVNVYDAATFVLQQSLHAPETVTGIQGSPDGSILFFAHSYSVTTWDIQTGGLTHTFTTQSEIKDIAVPTIGDHIACGTSDGSVAFWNIHTKKEGEGFGNGQPVVTIRWMSPLELAVATQRTVYIHDIGTGETSNNFSVLGHVWGMVRLGGEGQFLVGTSQPDSRVGQNSCFLRITIPKRGGAPGSQEPKLHFTRPLTPLGEELSSPALAGGEIACITTPSGVRSFDTKSCDSRNSPPLLDAATSVVVSLNRNLVAQTKDSIQIFSLDVLQSSKARNDVSSSHVYPLGGKHIVHLLQPSRRLTLLELETLRELHPDGTTPTLESLPTSQSPSVRASSSHGLVAEFGVSVIMQAWRSGAPLPEWPEAADEDPPLGELSPDCTRIVAFYSSPRRELRVKDAKDGTILANLLLGDDDLEMGEVYDVTFDSATRFHLKIDGPGRHLRIPYDIVASPSGPHSHTIVKGEPVPLSEPRAVAPYTLDANYEWVVDAEFRKVCWISPGNVWRGHGGHFWAGLSLVMVGDDGVVRKLSFREPDS